MGLSISEKTRQLLKDFSIKNPKVREELIEHTKHSMAETIYNENQTKEYINWVKDTLRYINRYF